MTQHDENTYDVCRPRAEPEISRRLAVGASAVTIAGLLSRSVFGQSQAKPSGARGADPNASASRRGPQRADESMAFLDRMSSASSPEERAKVMAEMSAASRQRAVEALKDQLGVSDREWPVIKPRLEGVYNLVHPVQQPQLSAAQPTTDLEQKSRDLRELLKDEKAPTEQIKTKLTAFRTAKEKANQDLTKARENLRQVVTLRQEALLVLNGLLT